MNIAAKGAWIVVTAHSQFQWITGNPRIGKNENVFECYIYNPAGIGKSKNRKRDKNRIMQALCIGSIFENKIQDSCLIASEQQEKAWISN